MRTKTVLAVISSALLLTACTTPQHQSGDAAPAGSAAPTAPATTATPSATPSAPSSSAPASTGTSTQVLGPLGYGALRLGMTKEQATATGLLTAFDNSGCPQAFVRGLPAGQGRVFLSPQWGLAAIQAWPTLPTVEGLRIGASADEARRLYSNWTTADGTMADGRHYPKVPGNDAAVYRITTANSKVGSVTLQLANQDCYE